MIVTMLLTAACTKTPKGKKGFFETESNIGTLFESTSYLPEAKEGENAKTSINLSLSELPAVLGLGELLPLKIGAESTIEGEKSNVRLSLYAFDEQLTAEAYTVGEELYLSLPDLLSRCIRMSFDFEDLGVAPAASMVDFEKLLKVTERYGKALQDAIPEDCFGDGKFVITVDGKDVNAPTTTLTLNRGHMETVIRALCEEAKGDAELKELLEQLAAMTGNDLSLYSDDWIDEVRDSVLEALDDECELVWTRTYQDGVSVAEYIRLKDAEGEVVINYAYYDGKNTAEGKFSVKYYPKDEADAPEFDGFDLDYRLDKAWDGSIGKLTLRVGDEVVFILDTTVKTKKDGMTADFTATIPNMPYEGETSSVTLTGNLNVTKENDHKTAFTFSAELTALGMVFGFEGDGKVEVSSDIHVTAPDTANAYDSSNEADSAQLFSDLLAGLAEKNPKLFGLFSGGFGAGLGTGAA